MLNFILVFILFSFSREIPPPPITKAPEIKRVFRPDSTILAVKDNKKIINDLHILHPAFRNKVITLIYECKKQGITLKIVETYRTPERQDFLKVKKRTMLSGGCSKHQHFMAIDIVPIVNGKAQWHNKKLWDVINKEAKKLGLIHGGDWRKFKDFPHLEYPIHIDSIKNVVVPDTVIIPLFN